MTELGLVGLKLYPMYQHWSVNDPEVAFPIFEKAEALEHPGDDPSGGFDQDRREARARPAGDARRHGPYVPAISG